MKNKMTVTVIITILLFAMLASCSGKELPGQPPKDEAERLEFLTERYERAEEVYSWFDLCTLPAQPNTVELDGAIWNEADVSDPSLGFTDYNGFCELVNSLFSSEIAAHLLDSGLYRDIDGKLYVMEAARGSDISIGEVTRYEVTENSKTSLTFTVYYETMSEDDPTVVSGEGSARYTYEVVNGTWVFSAFELYK